MMAANNNFVLHGHQNRYLLDPDILHFYFFNELDQFEEFAKEVVINIHKVNTNKMLHSLCTQYLFLRIPIKLQKYFKIIIDLI